ncbi:MAG: hypothetical protein AMJ94_00955 [Deltaproteobacteria bacterium SM23_61]|nr:MAG: hypothetical protein AMJ94_00955 [Deltaproteobacteria bacterium SM23_61]
MNDAGNFFESLIDGTSFPPGYYQRAKEKGKSFLCACFSLSAVDFVLFFPRERQACGPEGRAVGEKSIGGRRIPAGDPIGFPQIEAVPRPVQEMICAS